MQTATFPTRKKTVLIHVDNDVDIRALWYELKNKGLHGSLYHDCRQTLGVQYLTIGPQRYAKEIVKIVREKEKVARKHRNKNVKQYWFKDYDCIFRILDFNNLEVKYERVDSSGSKIKHISNLYVDHNLYIKQYVWGDLLNWEYVHKPSGQQYVDVYKIFIVIPESSSNENSNFCQYK